MGRRVSITVRRSRRWRAAPDRVAQWRALTPKYAALYEALTAISESGGGTDRLARLAHVGTGKVRKMLEGARLLGFVRERMPDKYELRTLPAVYTLTDEKAEALSQIGAPLWHGNNEYAGYTCSHYVRWCKTFKSQKKREYVPQGEDVSKLGFSPDDFDEPEERFKEKVGIIMPTFIEAHRILALDEHPEFRERGVTFETFCALYSVLDRKLKKRGIIVGRRKPPSRSLRRR